MHLYSLSSAIRIKRNPLQTYEDFIDEAALPTARPERVHDMGFFDSLPAVTVPSLNHYRMAARETSISIFR
jgi:hypothetical protein